MKAASIIVMTHAAEDGLHLPHVRMLQKSNPDKRLHVLVGEDSGHGKEYDWKNSDQQLRRWWKKNGSRVLGPVIAILEWDTYVEIPLPELPSDLDLAGAMALHKDMSRPLRGRLPMKDPRWNPEAWWWWNELPKLGGIPGVALVSFGCMLVRREALDAMADPRWDQVYADSIQNELRFPSVINASGFRVGETYLPGVHHDATEVEGYYGIWHAVKEAQG